MENYLGLPNAGNETPSWASSGTPSRTGAGAYGGIPQLPSYTKDISTQLGPDVYAQLTKNLPGYQSMVSQSSGNIGANLAGQLSPDVISQLQTQAAERGISTGAPGSPNNNAAYLKALGLNSLQLQQLAESQLTQAIQRTPIQQSQTGTQQTDLAAQQAIYNAAPNPAMAAGASLGAARAGIGAGFGGGAQAPTIPTLPASPLGAMGYGALPDYGTASSPYTDPYANWAALGIPGMGLSSSPYTGGQLAGVPGLGGDVFDTTQFNVGDQTMSDNYGTLPYYAGSYPINLDQVSPNQQ